MAGRNRQNSNKTVRDRAADTGSGATDDAALAGRLDRIKKLTDELALTQADSVDARELAERIKREVDAAREALQLHKP